MRMRAFIILAIAVVLGVIAVMLINQLLETRERTGVAQAVKTQPVVVANADLNVGTRLNSAMLKVVDWPADSVPKQAYGSVGEVLGEDEPPVALKEMRKGEAVLPYKVSPHGARGGLTAKIPAQMRAITIAVNEVRGVAGFVLPGDRVDVMLTTEELTKDETPLTRTLLQNVQVLGVDQLASEKEDQPKVANAVTLLVSPTQGKKLTLAQQIGDLNLMLRSEGDTSLAQEDVITLAELRAASAQDRPQVVARTNPQPRPSPEPQGKASSDSGEKTSPETVKRPDGPVKVPARRTAQAAPPPRQMSVEVIRGLEITEEEVESAEKVSEPGESTSTTGSEQ